MPSGASWPAYAAEGGSVGLGGWGLQETTAGPEGPSQESLTWCRGLCVEDLLIFPLLLGVCLDPQQQVSASKALLLCLQQQHQIRRLSAMIRGTCGLFESPKTQFRDIMHVPAQTAHLRGHFGPLLPTDQRAVRRCLWSTNNDWIQVTLAHCDPCCIGASVVFYVIWRFWQLQANQPSKSMQCPSQLDTFT